MSDKQLKPYNPSLEISRLVPSAIRQLQSGLQNGAPKDRNQVAFKILEYSGLNESSNAAAAAAAQAAAMPARFMALALGGLLEVFTNNSIDRGLLERHIEEQTLREMNPDAPAERLIYADYEADNSPPYLTDIEIEEAASASGGGGGATPVNSDFMAALETPITYVHSEERAKQGKF